MATAESSVGSGASTASAAEITQPSKSQFEADIATILARLGAQSVAEAQGTTTSETAER